MSSPSPQVESDTNEDVSEETSKPDDQSSQTETTPSTGMTPEEKIWWSMSFDELYQHAARKGFSKTRHGSRHNGRVRIIRWLCEQEGIIPYRAPTTTPAVEARPEPIVRSNGAIAHPESILRTSNPTQQSLIADAEKKYLTWTTADLLTLAMERSYQLLKDSKGKLPSRSKKSMATWLAAWDVMKSPREKKWWLGDGIDLVNRAKALGYQGPSKKYEVIVWLRSVPEDAELESATVAEPTPVYKRKREADGAVESESKRHAKGSKREKSNLSRVSLSKNRLLLTGGKLARRTTLPRPRRNL